MSTSVPSALPKEHMAPKELWPGGTGRASRGRELLLLHLQDGEARAVPVLQYFGVFFTCKCGSREWALTLLAQLRTPLLCLLCWSDGNRKELKKIKLGGADAGHGQE